MEIHSVDIIFLILMLFSIYLINIDKVLTLAKPRMRGK
jgi:hypothetical protein